MAGLASNPSMRVVVVAEFQSLLFIVYLHKLINDQTLNLNINEYMIHFLASNPSMRVVVVAEFQSWLFIVSLHKLIKDQTSATTYCRRDYAYMMTLAAQDGFSGDPYLIFSMKISIDSCLILLLAILIVFLIIAHNCTKVWLERSSIVMVPISFSASFAGTTG